MDCIGNENENHDIKEESPKEESRSCNTQHFDEKPLIKWDTEDIEMKLEATISEEFDIKDEFSNDNDSDTDIPAENAAKIPPTEEAINWPEQDLTTLIKRIELAIPDLDNLAYNTRVEKLNWDDIAFQDYSGADCKNTWLLIQKRVRRFRLLSEVLQDAKQWASKPWTDYYRRKKTKNCPDMPKRPLSVYMLFFLKMKDEILAKNPGQDITEVTKQISQIYKNLSSKEREKYTNMALSEKKNYEKKLNDFYLAHPKIPRQVDKPADIKNKKPLTPFFLYFKSQLKDPELDNNTFKEECKKRWKNFTDNEKVVWINLALDNEAKYQDEIKDYLTQNPDFTPTISKPILTKEEKSLIERLAGKPTKPPTSAYSLFSAMMLQSEDIKKIPPKERMKAVADEWKNSKDEEKKPFQERINEMMKQYKEEVALYLESLPECKRQEEAQNFAPKRKNKDIEKNKKNSDKKKKPNEESSFDEISKTELPQPPQEEVLTVPKREIEDVEENGKLSDKNKNPNEESNYDNIFQAEPSQPQEEVQNAPKRKIKNEKSGKSSQKKKRPNEESSFDESFEAEPPQPSQEEVENTPKRKIKVEKNGKNSDKKKNPNEESNVDNILQAEAPQPPQEEVQKSVPKRKIKNVEKKGKNSAKKKKPNKGSRFDKNFKAEPPQPPLSGFSLFSRTYKGSSPKKIVWKTLTKQEKDVYAQKVKTMKQKYIKEYEKYLKSLSKEELLAFSKLKLKKNETDVSDNKDEEVE